MPSNRSNRLPKMIGGKLRNPTIITDSSVPRAGFFSCEEVQNFEKLLPILGSFNPYSTGNLFDQYKKMKKSLKNDWTPGTWVSNSSESTQWEISNEYQHNRWPSTNLPHCVLGKSSLSIGRVKLVLNYFIDFCLLLLNEGNTPEKPIPPESVEGSSQFRV